MSKRKHRRKDKRRTPSARRLFVEACEPRHLLAALVDVGPLNDGIAVSDDATGSGFVMYSELATQPRFCLEFENADHLVAVRQLGENWQYNDDSVWTDFQPEATDRLLAQIDFDVDVVRAFEGTIEDGTLRSDMGIAAGYSRGDLNFFANQWAGAEDLGEIGVTGTHFTVPSTDPPPTATSADKVERLGLALLNFESATLRFPAHAIYSADSAPNLSWRVSVLPYLGYQALYDQFRLDEAWDSVHNVSLLDEMPDVFDSPSRETPAGHTAYQVLTGPRTVFPVSAEGVRLRDFAGYGLQHTLLLIETDADDSVPWTKPQDVSFDARQPLNSLPDESTFHVTLADGEVLEVGADSIDAQIWHNLAIRDSSGFTDTLQIAPPYEIETSLQKITRGILNYESALSRFPPWAMPSSEGMPLLSWRVAILPYIGHGALYEQFDRRAAWDSPQNLALLPQMPRVYAHPSVDGPFTTYLGASGEGTAFPVPTGSGVGRGAKFASLVESGRTALIVEADPARAIEWTKPGDLNYAADGSLPGAGDPVAQEFHVALVNGSVLEVPTGTSPDNWIEAGSDFFESAPHNLSELTIAALNHQSATNAFPTHAIYSDDDLSVPLLSWRVHLLPYLGYERLYDEFHLDESWDSTHNLSLLPQMPRVFAHPQISGFRTNYLAMTGENTTFPIGTERVHWLPDGLSRTLLFVEADVDQAVEWTKPEDILLDVANPLSGLGNIVESGFHASFADGHIQRLAANVSKAQFVSAVLRDDESKLPLLQDRRTGDVNLDGAVDELDFAIIRGNLFQPPELFYTWTTGDLNHDQIVDVSDFNLWLTNKDE